MIKILDSNIPYDGNDWKTQHLKRIFRIIKSELTQPMWLTFTQM